MTDYVLVRSSAMPDERARTLDQLARRIRDLAGARPLKLTPANISRIARPTGACIAVRANDGQLVGYAFAPAELLEAALSRTGVVRPRCSLRGFASYQQTLARCERRSPEPAP